MGGVGSGGGEGEVGIPVVGEGGVGSGGGEGEVGIPVVGEGGVGSGGGEGEVGILVGTATGLKVVETYGDPVLDGINEENDVGPLEDFGIKVEVERT